MNSKLKSRIREALTNLVLNAVDALPNGGQITLRTRVTPGEAKATGGDSPARVVVEVGIVHK